MNFKTFLTTKDSKGIGPRQNIVEAAEVILDRIYNGYKTSSIVLPPRVGKSNLMRSASIEAMELGLVGCTICLVPWTFLSEQLNDDTQISKMVLHHRMDNAPIKTKITYGILTGNNINPKFFQSPPIRHWWTMTMAQGQQAETRRILQQAATHFKQEGKPLLVFIDESHQTSSGPDGWGKLASELSDAGAHLVLLTGTPERSDNIAPFGFSIKPISSEAYQGKVSSKTTNGLIKIDTITGEKVEFELDPDYKMTLKEAWNQEIISKIDTRRFAFHVDGKDVVEESEYNGRRALSKALRDPDIAKGAVGYMLEELANKRKIKNDISAIVFVGSDRDEDEKDFECRQVKRIIESSWGDYFLGKADVKIATTDDDGGEKARNTIKKFVGNDKIPGVGDIIIVKQMGGVGLDAPRLKIALDLSTVRTKANTTQRWLRVATKYDGIGYGMLILPDDIGTTNLYNNIIREQGGQFSIENKVIIDTKYIDPISEENKKESPVITDFRRNGSVDMNMIRIDADQDLQVDIIFAQKPWLASIMSRSQIIELIDCNMMLVPDCLPPEPLTTTSIFNTEYEIKIRKNKVIELSKKLASREARYNPNSTDNKWELANIRYQAIAKSHAGIYGDLGKCLDISLLDKAVEFLEKKMEVDDNGTI